MFRIGAYVGAIRDIFIFSWSKTVSFCELFELPINTSKTKARSFVTQLASLICPGAMGLLVFGIGVTMKGKTTPYFTVNW